MDIKYYGNGKIFTSIEDNEFVTAFGISDGKFVWTGNTEDLEEDLEGDYEDLQGKTILPAFIESHMHPLLIARGVEQVAILPPAINSIDEMVTALKEKADTLEKDEWILGYGFDESKLYDHRTPTKEDLDRVSKDRPVMIIRSDYHSISVNSKVLELAEIDENTKDVPGGHIDRLETGEPTGFLMENARELVMKFLPPRTSQEDSRLLAKYGDVLSSLGFSTVSEMMSTINPENYFEVYESAMSNGFKQRANLYFELKDYDKDNTFDLSTLPEYDSLKVKGVKIFMDGDIVSQTAYMNEPYPFTENRGMPIAGKEELLKAYEYIKDKDLQLSIHAMGDASIDIILDTFEDVEPWVSSGPSIRIEHGAVMSEEQIKRAGKLSVGITHQPVFIYAEYKNYRKSLDDKKFYNTFSSASAYEYLKYFALSSDAPATTWLHPENPLFNLQIAVTRVNSKGFGINKAQKLPLDKAIIAYTKKAAELLGYDDIGVIDKDFSADFIILDRDIFEIDPMEISQIEVEKTYIKGEEVYSK